MDPDLKWVIGVTITVAIAAVMAIIAGFKGVYTKISKGDGLLHDRIEIVKDLYVRREHLDVHINHIGERLDSMKQDSQRRHDELLQRIADMKK